MVLCQDNTRTEAITFLQGATPFIVLCPTVIGTGPNLDQWPTTIETRGDSLTSTQPPSYWSQGLLGALMHEMHHVLKGGNKMSELTLPSRLFRDHVLWRLSESHYVGSDIVLNPPVKDPDTGRIVEQIAYSYLGATTLVNQVRARMLGGQSNACKLCVRKYCFPVGIFSDPVRYITGPCFSQDLLYDWNPILFK